MAYAFIAGPIEALVHLPDKGEIEITDDVLNEVFARAENSIALREQPYPVSQR